MRLHLRTLTSALSLFVVSCAVGLWVLHQTHRWPKGDGPHYAIMASSLVNRGSFDVKPSYISGDYIGVFSYEPLDFHVNPQYFSLDSPAWYSYHSFGVPLLLAPFLLAGQHLHISALSALQLGMVLFQALGVVVVYLYALALVRHNMAALVAAFTLLGSMSYLSLVGHLYPDLLTATVLVGSLLCLLRLRHSPQSLLPIAVLSALVGFGPYLHVKTCLMSLTLLALGLLHWWRNGRSGKMLACLLLPAGALLAAYALIDSCLVSHVDGYCAVQQWPALPLPTRTIDSCESSRHFPWHSAQQSGLPADPRRPADLVEARSQLGFGDARGRHTLAGFTIHFRRLGWRMLSGGRALHDALCLLRTTRCGISVREGAMVFPLPDSLAYICRSCHRGLQHAHGLCLLLCGRWQSIAGFFFRDVPHSTGSGGTDIQS